MTSTGQFFTDFLHSRRLGYYFDCTLSVFLHFFIPASFTPHDKGKISIMLQKISHDRLFKELITTLFFEFLQLFVPELAADVDLHSFEFVNKELISDAADGKVYLADIVVKCRFKGRKDIF